MKSKVMLVGECNPYGADPAFALYPAPDGCSGHRLCTLILGMHRRDYMDVFDRVNLLAGKWSAKAAREAAAKLWRPPGGGATPRFILCGAKVSAAFQVPFIPFEISEGGTMLVLPHPSGLCRLWHEDSAIDRARAAVTAFAPELAELIGRAAK